MLPITDDKIKEVYLYYIYTKESGQNKISVYIFPFKMTDFNFDYYKKYYDEELINFCKNLKTGLDLFQKNKKELTMKVDKTEIIFFNY